MNDRRSEDRLENFIGWLLVAGTLLYFGAHVVAAFLLGRVPWLH